MKILIGLVTLDPGGAEFQMVLLANGLRQQGHEVTFLLWGESREEAWVEVWGHIPIRRASAGTFWDRVQTWRCEIQDLQPDVVIGSMALPQLALWWATPRRIPLIGRRGASWGDFAHYPCYRHIPRYLRRVRWLTARRTAAVVCNARHVLTSVRDLEGWPEDKLRVIRSGWPEAQKADWRTSQVASSCGTAERPEKNETVGPLVPGLEEMKEGVRVYFGPPAWREVGIYMHPFRSEGCSNAIGMAMAHAIPVVCWGVQGNLELRPGLPTVEPFDTPAFRAEVSRLYHSQDARCEEGLRGRAVVRDHFGLKRMVGEWEALLEKVVHG